MNAVVGADVFSRLLHSSYGSQIADAGGAAARATASVGVETFNLRASLGRHSRSDDGRSAVRHESGTDASMRACQGSFHAAPTT